MSCARRSSPTGGLKDSIPPELLRAYPKMNSTLFDKDEIELVFDEYIKIKDLGRQLIISPPIEKSYYKVRRKGLPRPQYSGYKGWPQSKCLLPL